MKQDFMYLNGEFLPEDQVHISPKAHALHYGTGCFEGIRAYYNEKQKALLVFRLDDHFKRFQESCSILFIDLGKNTKALSDAVVELLKKNYSETDIYIRPLAFKSDPAVGNFNLQKLASSLLIYTTPLGRYLNTEKGIRANVSSWTRTSDKSIPPRGKITGAYVNTALAKTESLLGGFDEALLLDGQGHVVEGSAENLFIIKNGTLITPAQHDDILVGITRNTILHLAQNELKMPVIERSIDRTELYNADEIFVCGTGAEVTPLIEVDYHPIGGGTIGSITKQLKDMYYAIVHGEVAAYNHWLTKVTI